MLKPNLHPQKNNDYSWVEYTWFNLLLFFAREWNNYCKELQTFYEKLRKKACSGGCILLHDNARPRISRLTIKKLLKLKIELYFPDLSVIDFYHFHWLDNSLRNKNNENMLKSAFQAIVSSLTPNFKREGIEMLVSRREKCIDSEGTDSVY